MKPELHLSEEAARKALHKGLPEMCRRDCGLYSPVSDDDVEVVLAALRAASTPQDRSAERAAFVAGAEEGIYSMDGEWIFDEEVWQRGALERYPDAPASGIRVISSTSMPEGEAVVIRSPHPDENGPQIAGKIVNIDAPSKEEKPHDSRDREAILDDVTTIVQKCARSYDEGVRAIAEIMDIIDGRVP